MNKVIQIDSDAHQQITEILEPIILYKHKMLSKKNWEEFSGVWLPSLLSQLDNRRFEIHHPKKNTLYWLIDQIEHSKVKPHSKAQSLDTTEQGRQVIILLKAMLGGYYTPRSKFDNIFSIESK
jgi:hypothetical protein